MKYTKVYYMMCGTNGKKVEFSYLLRTDNKNAYFCDPKTGEENGHSDLKSCFFTPEHAINDWRMRSSAETTEHIDILKNVGEELIHRAEKMRINARTIGAWQDL